MIEAIGTPKEAPVVEAAIARALGATRIVRHGPETDILHEPEPLPELFRAMQMMYQRGYEIGPNLKEEAPACAYFRWLADQPGPRTVEWDKAFEMFHGDDSFVVREAALRSIPPPAARAGEVHSCGDERADRSGPWRGARRLRSGWKIG